MKEYFLVVTVGEADFEPIVFSDLEEAKTYADECQAHCLSEFRDSDSKYKCLEHDDLVSEYESYPDTNSFEILRIEGSEVATCGVGEVAKLLTKHTKLTGAN